MRQTWDLIPLISGSVLDLKGRQCSACCQILPICEHGTVLMPVKRTGRNDLGLPVTEALVSAIVGSHDPAERTD